MTRKLKKIRFAYLTDHSINEIVNAHIKYVTEDDMEMTLEKVDDGDAEQKRFPSYKEVWKVINTNTNPAPRKAILTPKYQFLIHVIIMRCRRRNGACRLDYSFFTELFGKVFGDMLHNLSRMGIIYLSEKYTVGQKSRLIELLDWNIDFYDNIDNLIIRNYIKKLENHLDKLKKDNDKKIEETLGKNFTKTYNKNLSKLELVKKDEAIEYVNNRNYISKVQEQYYKSSIEDFDNKKCFILNIDKRGRIYHYLTNCPRLIRGFFNLKFDVDIANSQPLLFCNFLIKKYSIKDDVIQNLINIDNNLLLNNDIESNYNYYKGKLLCKILKKSDLWVHDFDYIPSDVLLYIYSCSKGLFWDDFVDTFAELDRGEVKENLFREVFYSHSRTLKYKKYGKVFADIYPSVWNLIKEMKRDAEQLCDKITKVESELFHGILKECFKRGWAVVSIHDAVVVLDVETNRGINEDELVEIIMNKYSKIGLIPTLHIEKF